MNKKTPLMLLPVILLAALTQLAGCNRAPDCNSTEAQNLVRTTVYSVIKNSAREDGDPPAHVVARRRLPPDVSLSERHQAMLDVYHPQVTAAYLRDRFRVKIAQRVPHRYKEFEVPLILAMDNFAMLRQVIDVRLSDITPLPDDEAKAYGDKQICRAQLNITPRHPTARPRRALNITYGINPPPRSSRSNSASPLYIAISPFEVKPAALGFQLSDSEKVALMATGATRSLEAQPREYDATDVILSHAFQAALTHLEAVNTPISIFGKP